MPKDLLIEPSTKVAALLDHYPELEETLIGIAPPFKKLKNPILRRSVAKVASLKQAAAVGRVSLTDMINTLRAAVGQEPMATDETGGAESYFEDQPNWFDENKIVGTISEKGADENTMTLTEVLQQGAHMEPGQIIELRTPFLPAPAIDIMKNKGYLVWATEENPDSVKTYFSKPTQTE